LCVSFTLRRHPPSTLFPYTTLFRSAALYGIKQRGELRAGYYADLLLFDPRTVGRTANRRVFDLPAGASRLTCDAVGVHGVWVNGERIADANGVRTRERLPGRLLRDFAA